MYNKVILVGNLTRDIELRYTQSGAAVASTAIATSHKYTSNGEKKEEVCFTDITFFGKSAEIANQYIRKGSKILVEGRLKLDQWEDKNGGGKRSKHSVMVETMKMLDTKNDNQSNNGQTNQASQNGGYQQQQQQYQPQQQQSYQANQQQSHTDYRQPQQQMPDKNALPSIDIDMEEIPF